MSQYEKNLDAVFVLSSKSWITHCIHSSRNQYKVKYTRSVCWKRQIRKSVRMLSPLTKTNNRRSSRKTLEFGRERLQTYEKGNNDSLYQSKLFTIQTLEMSSKATYCLVRRICDKTWHAAANTITNQSELYPKF